MATRAKKPLDIADEPSTFEAPPPPPEDAPAPPEAETMTIGPTPAVGTPGWYVGIGSRPETAEEHATRLGDSAGTSADIGWMLGSLEPRAEWPGRPPVVEEPEEP